MRKMAAVFSRRSLIAMMPLLFLSSSICTAQSEAPVSKYVLGQTQYNRDIEKAKRSASSEAEFAGWRIGYENEKERIKLSVTLFNNGTVRLSMYGTDASPLRYRINGRSLEVYDSASQSYSPFGTFGGDGKTLTILTGVTLDME